MPYWMLVLHDGVANTVSGYLNGFVYLLETLGVTHDIAVGLATGSTLAMFGTVVVWLGAKLRSALKRGADAARQRLRRQASES